MPDEVIARLAEAQHGVVARRQLIDLGLGGHLERRVANGRLRPVHRGVYAVGHAALTLHGRWMAAVLACGPDAVLSHRDAAQLWGLYRSNRARIDVTVPSDVRRDRGGLDVHRTKSLRPDDITVVEAIPCTSWPRTLLDLAALVPPHRLEQALHRADDQHLLDLHSLHVVLTRTPNPAGGRRLRTVLEAYRPDDRPESELEIRFHRLCAEARLPKPQLNRWLTLPDGRMVRPDALWPDQRLVVEIDGWEHHRARHHFESDRLRDADLVELGYRVVRVTHRQLTGDPHGLAARLKRLLAPGSLGTAPPA